MLKHLIIGVVAVLSLSAASADTTVKSYIPNAETVGEVRVSVLFWDVYDATLKAPNGTLNTEKPFALTLNYLRDISGKDIADSSTEEIRKLGFDNEIKLATWHTTMRDIFPDVTSGTELTGIYQPDAATRFYRGNEYLGEVTDPEFGEWFFGIWLNENTSKPQHRKLLLGLK